MQTTLHNHVRLGDGTKPLIPNAVMKALLTLLMHDDIKACDYIIKCYELAPAQKSIYDYWKKEWKR